MFHVCIESYSLVYSVCYISCSYDACDCTYVCSGVCSEFSAFLGLVGLLVLSICVLLAKYTAAVFLAPLAN